MERVKQQEEESQSQGYQRANFSKKLNDRTEATDLPGKNSNHATNVRDRDIFD